MYSRLYRGRSRKPLARRYSLDSYIRYTRDKPWYGPSRNPNRLTVLEKDRLFWVPLNPEKEKERIPRGRPVADEREKEKEKEKEKPPVLVIEPKVLETKLKVESVDLHIEENAEEHHTDMYECTSEREREWVDNKPTLEAELVVRRGQEFKMTINFSREYNIATNDIRLTFKLAGMQRDNPKLYGRFLVNETGEAPYKAKKKWGATVVSKEDKSLTLMVYIPPNVPIGEYAFSIRTIVDREEGKDLIWEYHHDKEEINVILNPWCKDDSVYVEEDPDDPEHPTKWMDEVVLNDSGAVYCGNTWSISGRAWYFGQFDDGILDVVFLLIRKVFDSEATSKMGDPICLARNLAAMVNAPDDGGVLVGNWSGDYSGGESPLTWNGSVRILRDFWKTRKPVRFGQCWVFSGVLTAVCRAIGMPCRSVTNFSSAHNTDTDNLTIDTYYDYVNGEWVKDKYNTNDSVWNFHVWNEVCLRRPDLSPDHAYDGWQAIDATPQELSDGIYTCGPAPIKGICDGSLVGYDAPFIFAEVNADRVTWRRDPETDQLFEHQRFRARVGKCISTYKPKTGPRWDRLERLDVTHLYKPKEGTQEEKEAYMCAHRKICPGEEEDLHDCDEPEDIELTIDPPEDGIIVGNGFTYTVHAKNTSSKEHTVDFDFSVYYETYFGNHAGEAIQKKAQGVVLKAGESKSFDVYVDEDKGCSKPEHSFNFDLEAIASIQRPGGKPTLVTETQLFRLRRPDITFEGPKTCVAGQPIQVKAIFKNPLNRALTNCKIKLDGNLVPHGSTRDESRLLNVPPNMDWDELVFTLMPSLKPKKKKTRDLTVSFDSKELQDVCGNFEIDVVDA